MERRSSGQRLQRPVNGHEGSRSESGTAIGVGPGLCDLPRTRMRRSSENSIRMRTSGNASTRWWTEICYRKVQKPGLWPVTSEIPDRLQREFDLSFHVQERRAGVLDRGYATFREPDTGEVRRMLLLGTSVNKAGVSLSLSLQHHRLYLRCYEDSTMVRGNELPRPGPAPR